MLIRTLIDRPDPSRFGGGRHHARFACLAGGLPYARPGPFTEILFRSFMSSHKHQPPHTVPRYPHNTRVERELLLILAVSRISETSRGTGRRWTRWRSSSHPPRKSGRRGVPEMGAATPWRPEHRRGTWRPGLRDRPPGVWGERPVGEGVLRALHPPARGAAVRARDLRSPACAVVALGLVGAAEIRRCFPNSLSS
jgi:hypothetical protein